MAKAYPDLIQPVIVRQTSQRVEYCACGLTQEPPFCDNSHVGTGISPHVIEVSEPTTMAICQCWKSADGAYCDGTHARLVLESGNAT